jgi:hypothetical protein
MDFPFLLPTVVVAIWFIALPWFLLVITHELIPGISGQGGGVLLRIRVPRDWEFERKNLFSNFLLGSAFAILGWPWGLLVIASLLLPLLLPRFVTVGTLGVVDNSGPVFGLSMVPWDRLQATFEGNRGTVSQPQRSRWDLGLSISFEAPAHRWLAVQEAIEAGIERHAEMKRRGPWWSRNRPEPPRTPHL